jgi:hypothetical protein
VFPLSPYAYTSFAETAPKRSRRVGPIPLVVSGVHPLPFHFNIACWNEVTNTCPGAGHCRSIFELENVDGTEVQAVPSNRNRPPLFELAANASFGPVMQTPRRRVADPNGAVDTAGNHQLPGTADHAGDRRE